MKNANQNPADFHVSLKVVLKDKSGNVLLLRSLPKDFWMGFYDLPGGRINKSEVPANYRRIIIRELGEEIGPKARYRLDLNPVAIGSWLRDVPQKSKLYVFFVLFQATYLGGEIRYSSEHSGFEWKKISVQKLKKDFHPSLSNLMTNYFKWNQK